jgi:YhcH/YjgK/YiaL family protein
MIYDRLENIGNYSFLHPNLKKAVRYLIEEDILSHKEEKFVIEEGELFVNLIENMQGRPEEKKYECHHDFVDIHITLEGLDYIRSTDESNLVVTTPYDRAGDYLLGDCPGDEYAEAYIPRGCFALYLPKDAHMVNGTPKERGRVRKFVMKVKVK